MIWLLLIIIVVLYVYMKNNKTLHTNCVCMINGAPKTGKDTLEISQGLKKYNKQLLKYYFKKYILFKDIEKPLLYCNIPLTCSYVPLTKEILERKKRPTYGSVIIISEMSLLANSMGYKDEELNERLTLFVKLYGHETHGGYLYINTQAIEDNHFAVKRCLDSYIYIHHTIKWIPFILISKVREMKYSSDNQGAMNVFNEDIEESMKTIVYSKSVWKKFDCYAFSSLTDDLEVEDNVLPKNKKRDLKAREIISFIDYKTINVKGGALSEAKN